MRFAGDRADSLLRSVVACAAATLLLIAASESLAETYPRISAAEGTVVSHKTGEEAKFVDLATWRPVDVDQGLLAGDTLRTNATGSLAIRFADKTLVRMGRNTTLIVKKIDSSDESALGLTEGAVWARAVRGGSRLQIDTPAAAAAIRGTDWTLRVNGTHTTLTVLEGAVELKNPQGSVLVSQGEGATATLGQAPRKYVLVNLREREQLLLYTELRGVFSSLPVTNMSGPQSRAERRRILALTPSTRSQDDWLVLAETSLLLCGRAETRAALLHVRRPLTARLAGRVTLVEAMLEAQETHYIEAARLFSVALPALPRSRKAAAAYGLWFARSLADPDRSHPPPALTAYTNDPVSILARAAAIAHLNGQAEAIKLIEDAEKRFPGNADLPAMRAGLALELDRRDQVKEALDRARRLDPDNPTYLVANARFKSVVSSDLDGALADLQHATAVAPGADDAWNELAIVQSDRNAIVEAAEASRRAIALNPENPALHANYARFLMDNDQMGAAKLEIDAAEAIDPHSAAVFAAKGRYLLRLGKSAEGEKALLEASAVNPTYGDTLIGLAIAGYQQNVTDETMQALDNADRFDPANPSIPLIRSGIALDQFQADQAIIEAREALRRRQQRGGTYSGYDANRQASSYLGVTLENLGMDEWGQFHADRAYDPFKSSSYIDEAVKGRTSPFAALPPSGLDRFPNGATSFSSQLQGLLLDPLAVSSEIKRNSLERRSFFEAALGGSILDRGNGPRPSGNVLLQGTSYSSLPVSYIIQAEGDRQMGLRQNDASDFNGGLVQLGIRPTLEDSVVLFANKYRQDEEFPGQIFAPTPFDAQQTDNQTIGGAWSHTLGDRNVLQMFAVSSETDTQQRFTGQVLIGDSYYDSLIKQRIGDRYNAFGIGHILGVGPVTLRYGIEATRYDSNISATAVLDESKEFFDIGSSKDDFLATRSYLDATLDVSRNLQFQAGAYIVRIDGDSGRWGLVDPRLGIAWSPIEGQWLRAYFRQDTQMPSDYTLSPISTVGLAPMELPQVWGGQTSAAALRWDAEWNERLFTSVEYQHLKFNGLSLSPEDVLTSFQTTDGQIDRLNFSGNYWIGNGIGAFGSLALYRSKDLTSGWDSSLSVPLVPDYSAQIGVKYVHPSRVTAAIAQNFVGKRVGVQYTEGDTPKVIKLGGYATTDMSLTWTSENRTVDWGIAVNNIFDHRIESALDVPAPGRTVTATFTARF